MRSSCPATASTTWSSRSRRPATTRRWSRPGCGAAVAGEQVASFLVHHEPTIDRDEVRRHITVVVLTPTRLILCHTDEHAPDDLLPEPYTSTSTEAITADPVRSVVVNRMVANPATFAGGGEPTPSEAVLTVGWGGINRIDLEPAACCGPRVRGRPRLHRRGRLRRLLAPGELGRRRAGGGRRAARVRREPLGAHPGLTVPSASVDPGFVEPDYSGALARGRPGRRPAAVAPRSVSRSASTRPRSSLPPAPAYVVMLVDGLGHELLAEHRVQAPYLHSLLAGAGPRPAACPRPRPPR